MNYDPSQDSARLEKAFKKEKPLKLKKTVKSNPSLTMKKENKRRNSKEDIELKRAAFSEALKNGIWDNLSANNAPQNLPAKPAKHKKSPTANPS